MSTTRQDDPAQIVQAPAGTKSPALIPIGAIEKFDRQGPTAPGHEERGDTEYLLAQGHADNVLKAKQLSPEQRERICTLLLGYLAPSRMFARGPEAKEVTELLDAIVAPKRLLELLRQSEEAGRLRPKTADALEDAFSHTHNPAIILAKRIQHELKLYPIGSRTGRPNLFMVALVADAVADELHAALGKPQWRVVADVLRPFLKLHSRSMACDQKHVRQLIVTNQGRKKRMVLNKETTFSWDDEKAALYQDAGLTRPGKRK